MAQQNALSMLQQQLWGRGNEWLLHNAPFPTIARPVPPAVEWTDKAPVMDPADPDNYGPGSPFGQQPPSPELLKQMMEWWTMTQVQPQQLGLNSMLSR